MATELERGTTFAGFRVEEMLDERRTSVVYRAVDVQLGRVVALKVLSIGEPLGADGGGDEQFRRRFVDEARLVSGIDHPNVIPIYSFGEEAGLLFVAMRYVTGGVDLQTTLRQTGPLSPTETLSLLTQAARAIDAVHRAGVIHGDVRPDKLLLSRPGDRAFRHLYLTDFGLARTETDRERLEPGATSLSNYAAPEQLNDGDIDSRADVYSLGCVLFEVLSGREAFERRPGEVASGQRPGDPVPSLHELRPELPLAIDAVISTALAFDPGQRYQTCVALLEAAFDALRPVVDSGVDPDVATRVRSLPGADPGDGGPGSSSPSTTSSNETDGAETVIAAGPPARLRASRSSADEVDDAGTVVAAGPPARVRSMEGSAADGGGASGAAQSGGGEPPRRSRTAVTVGLAVVVLVALVAVALLVTRRSEPPPVAVGPSTSATATPGGTIRMGVPSRPTGWNPTHDVLGPVDLLVARGIYDPLMVERDGRAEPFLAESLTADPGYTEWKLRLRSGVTFHDGTPLDATAVQKSLVAAMAKPPMSTWLQPISTIRVDDNLSLSIGTRVPWPSFPATLSSQVGFVVAPAMLEAGGPVAVGTGPFKLSSDRDPRRVSLKKNAHYWRANEPLLNQIEFEVVVAASARTDQLLASEVDVAVVPRGETNRLVGGFSSRPLGRLVATLAFNTRRAAVAEIDRRRGLAMALDRQQLANGSPVVNSPFVDVPWVIEGPQSLDHNPAKAKELIDQSAGANPGAAARVQLATSATDEPLAKSIKEQWAAMGIDAVVNVVDPASLTTGQYDAVLIDLPVVGDPDIQYPQLHSVPDLEGAPVLNYSRSISDAPDAGLQTGRQSAGADERRTAYTGAIATLNDRVVGYAWLFVRDLMLVSVDQSFNLTAITDDLASPLATIGVQR